MEGYRDPGTHNRRGDHWTGRLLGGARPAALCAAAVGLLALSIYLRTMAPGLTWAHDSVDGGELAAAAQTLSIPHPPGYPTYVLLAHLFTYLPVGEVATRTNLFSALCAALAAALVTWTVARRTRQWVAAVCAGLALALCPLLWSQAIVTEVHALNGLVASLLLTLAVSTEPRGSTKPLAAAVGLVWGIGLGNHLTIALCAPLVALVLRRDLRAALLCIGGLALGLAVYLYLPVRAAADPPINWGDPRTLDRFLWVISGSPYRHFAFSLPLEHLPARLAAWAGLLARQFSWAGLVVCFLGAAALKSDKQSLLVATSVTLSLCSVFAIGYNTSDSYLYIVPALPCLGLWLGEGVGWLISALAARASWAARAGSALALLLPLVLGIYRLPQIDLCHDRAVYEFEAATLALAPQAAIIVSQRDAHTFALWYFQHALGERSDVTVVDSALLGYDWYTAQLSRQGGISAQASTLLAGEEDELGQAAHLTDRAICRIDTDGAGLHCFD